MKTFHSGLIMLLGFLVIFASSVALADNKGKGKHEKKDHEKDNKGIPDKVEALSQQVAALQDTVDAQAIQITELTALVEGLGGGGGGVDLDPINARLDDLESGQAVQDGRLDALESAVSGLDLSGINAILTGFSRVGTDLYIDSNIILTGDLDVDAGSVLFTTDFFQVDSLASINLLSDGLTEISSPAGVTVDSGFINIGNSSSIIFIGDSFYIPPP